MKKFTLVKATAKKNVIQTQIRVILEPTIAKLIDIYGNQEAAIKQIKEVLITMTGQASKKNYAMDNIINLLIQVDPYFKITDLKYLNYDEIRNREG